MRTHDEDMRVEEAERRGAERERARIVEWLRERANARLDRAEHRRKQGGPWGDSEADDAMAQHIALDDCASLIEGGLP